MRAQAMTRRAFVALAATALTMSLFGCGKEDGDASGTAGDGAALGAGDSGDAAVAGGWQVSAEVPANALTKEEQAVFDQAAKEYVGMSLQPVCVLATQVVSGTNYAFLCLGTPTVPNAEAGWYVAVAYEDLKGACSFKSVNEIDVAEPPLVAEESSQDEGADLGGWAVAPQVADEPLELPEAAAAAFAAGAEGYVGMGLRPLALLATQVVAGTNYRVLCVGAPAVPNAEPQLCVVDVYEDLKGAAEYSKVSTFDLLACV